MNQVNDINKLLAYLGGYFDGEGCVFIAKAKPKVNGRAHVYSLACTITSTDKAPLLILQKLFSGSLNVRKRYITNYPQYVWRVCSKDALNFIETIKDYSIIKRPQLEAAIEFQKTVAFRPKKYTEEENTARQAAYENMKNLKTQKINELEF